MANSATKLLTRVPNPTQTPLLHAVLTILDQGIGGLASSANPAQDVVNYLRATLGASHPATREIETQLQNALKFYSQGA